MYILLLTILLLYIYIYMYITITYYYYYGGAELPPRRLRRAPRPEDGRHPI